MKLTPQNLETVFLDCLFKDGEDTSNPAIAEGVVVKYGFNRERLAGHDRDIKDMLAELPEPFNELSGGGWSFLAACNNRDGQQWGEHRSIDQLLSLGIASGLAKILLPCDMWAYLPGGMPYFVILNHAQETISK